MSKNYKIGSKFRVTSNSTNGFNVGEIVNLVARRVDGLFEMDNGEFQQALYEDQFELVCEQLSQKLKPAKQALADAIHQNGGWVDSAAAAIFGKKTMTCAFLMDWALPVSYNPERGSWSVISSGVISGFKMKPFANWHQTILSREEYYHAYPKADADGWIEWNGLNIAPVKNRADVDIKFRDGDVATVSNPAYLRWSHHESPSDIIAYRLHKQDVKPEFCESVMRSIPEPESKPTIEQLAQDYRNKLDFANSKQHEADEAKAAADAALGELERAGEALGLLIGIAKPAREPELVITDWRGLQVNDVIFVGECDGYESGEYVVVWLEDSDYDGDFAVIVVGIDGIERCMDTAMEWRFIRRP